MSLAFDINDKLLRAKRNAGHATLRLDLTQAMVRDLIKTRGTCGDGAIRALRAASVLHYIAHRRLAAERAFAKAAAAFKAHTGKEVHQ